MTALTVRPSRAALARANPYTSAGARNWMRGETPYAELYRPQFRQQGSDQTPTGAIRSN
jgi:hypothetical protein